MIDLRSDTVTLPTPTMRKAMYEAELGDDVMEEDPTVKRLEALAAERMGKEAGLFVVSGTMGNLVSLLTHCGRGDEVIVGDNAHIYLYEVGGASALGGISFRSVRNMGAELDMAALTALTTRGPNIHFAPIRLVCLENTHNRASGMVLTTDYMRRVRDLATAADMRVHLDGARVFNAAIYLNVPAADIAQYADSVQFCVSKGLAAPVGSVITGSAEFIQRARKNRKMVGGGMRQVGVVAAAGIVALEQMVDRLAEDHTNARMLAEGIAEMPAYKVDLSTIQTDIVIFDATEKCGLDDAALVAAWAREGLKIGNIAPRRFRAVTHYGIEDTDIAAALSIMSKVA